MYAFAYIFYYITVLSLALLYTPLYVLYAYSFVAASNISFTIF